MNPPDTHAATVGYVNRKIASYIPKANLNIICFTGIQRERKKYQVKPMTFINFSCQV